MRKWLLREGLISGAVRGGIWQARSHIEQETREPDFQQIQRSPPIAVPASLKNLLASLNLLEITAGKRGQHLKPLRLLNRLTEVIQTNQTGGNSVLPKRVTMAYNALGLRTQLARFQSTGSTNPVATTDYTYDTANRLSGIAHKQGTTNLNTYAYTWDHRNRLTQVTERTSLNSLVSEINYEYDSSASPSMTHRYLWSDNVDELLADEQNPGLSSKNTLWALSDHLGSIRDIADRNETTGITAIANHRRYDSTGKRISETNVSVDLIFGYTGKLLDETTGLQNNLNRWLEPATGRWISQDPIGFAAGDTNLYRYVGNSDQCNSAGGR